MKKTMVSCRRAHTHMITKMWQKNLPVRTGFSPSVSYTSKIIAKQSTEAMIRRCRENGVGGARAPMNSAGAMGAPKVYRQRHSNRRPLPIRLTPQSELPFGLESIRAP